MTAQRAVRAANGLFPQKKRVPDGAPRRRKLQNACGVFLCFAFKNISHSFRCSSSFAKDPARFACSVVNAFQRLTFRFRSFAKQRRCMQGFSFGSRRHLNRWYTKKTAICPANCCFFRAVHSCRNERYRYARSSDSFSALYCMDSRSFSASPPRISTSRQAKGSVVPAPRLVIRFPSTTTHSSVCRLSST